MLLIIFIYLIKLILIYIWYLYLSRIQIDRDKNSKYVDMLNISLGFLLIAGQWVGVLQWHA